MKGSPRRHDPPALAVRLVSRICRHCLGVLSSQKREREGQSSGWEERERSKGEAIGDVEGRKKEK